MQSLTPDFNKVDKALNSNMSQLNSSTVALIREKRENLNELNEEVPLTTKQLYDLCETVANSGLGYNLEKNGGYAIMTDSSGNYWQTLYQAWWGQYEGIKNYYNVFNGVDSEGLISEKIFEQKGKLYSLKVLEELLKWDNGYVFQKATGYDYMQAQTAFLKGNGVFYCIGDWFADEMKEVVSDLKNMQNIDYEIRMMKTPIVSEIIELTPTITDDDMLADVIAAIDAGYETANFARQMNAFTHQVSEEDYAKIVEARGIIASNAPGHNVGIPSYAKGKEIAFDFLRYMATDKAQEIYIKETSGSGLPFLYNVKQKNAELYNSLPALQKDRLDMNFDIFYDINILPSESSFPLVKWGGMRAVHSLPGTSIVNYFIAKGAEANAQKLWEDDIAYYKTGFAMCMQKAGLG